MRRALGQNDGMRDVAILRSEYRLMGEAGVFEGRRVELVCGTIIDLRPMSAPHRTALRVLNRAFVELVPRDGAGAA